MSVVTKVPAYTLRVGLPFPVSRIPKSVATRYEDGELIHQNFTHVPSDEKLVDWLATLSENDTDTFNSGRAELIVAPISQPMLNCKSSPAYGYGGIYSPRLTRSPDGRFGLCVCHSAL